MKGPAQVPLVAATAFKILSRNPPLPAGDNDQ